MPFFNGNSGCSLSLTRDGFVSKVSPCVEYNKRLLQQMQKQVCSYTALLKRPGVVQYGYTDNNLFFFDMDYITGVPVPQSIATTNIIPDNLTRTIINLICRPARNKVSLQDFVYTNK